MLVGCGKKAPTKKNMQFIGAVQSMDVERAKKILAENKVNLNVRWFGRDAPPIYQAAYRYNAEMTKLLIENGADLSQRDFQGETALHTAAFHSPGKGLAVIQLLLNAGADVNARGKNGGTPLDGATNLKTLYLNQRRHNQSFTMSLVADLIRKHGGKTGEELKAEGK
jgi:hypothetical protein